MAVGHSVILHSVQPLHNCELHSNALSVVSFDYYSASRVFGAHDRRYYISIGNIDAGKQSAEHS